MIVLPMPILELAELSPLADIGIPLLGVLLITIGMMMGIRKKRRRASANTSAREHVDELRQKQAVRGDLEQLMIEVEQLAKRFGTQLDAKTMHMERLIDEANQKIDELKQLELARQNAPAPQPPQASPLTPHDTGLTPQASAPSPDDELKRSVCDLADKGHGPVEIARRLDEHVGKIELILALRKT
jgi:hypothetical protein